MSHQLPYAPALPWYRRRSWRRATIAIVLLSATTLTGIWLWKLKTQIEYARELHTMMTRNVPATPLPLQPHNVAHAYLHSARHGSGILRCIEVIAIPDDDSSLDLFTRATSIPTWQIGSRPQLVSQSSLRIAADRLFPGQPDPVDESHFTIRYELGSQPGTIDGWLMPDDTVKLELRTNSLK